MSLNLEFEKSNRKNLVFLLNPNVTYEIMCRLTHKMKPQL
jgi:hypothetical protein